jgi:23S rRNA (cytosine1962-C5)-methyltransferase
MITGMSVSLKLKPNAKARVLHGHPWVFANEVEALLSAAHDGAVVECRDRADRFLGSGIYNSKSMIVWRRFSRERAVLDDAFLRNALTRAVARRAADPCRRLVWTESDDLPGVVADQFGDTVVLQIQTLAMEQRAALIGDLLAELTGAREVVFRNDSNLRRLEGLPL